VKTLALFVIVSITFSREAKIRQLELDIAAAPKPERIEKYAIILIVFWKLDLMLNSFSSPKF